MPSDEPEELITVKGLADIGGDLPPVGIRVPPGHPYLSMREGERLPLDDRVTVTIEEELFLGRDHSAAIYSREISKAVADLAMQQAAEARDAANKALRARLEALRPGLVAAVQERLRGYYAECKRHEREPLTWDSASRAVGAVLEELEREYLY